MKDEEIDDVLKRAAGPLPEVDPSLIRRIAGSIGAGLQPVRPLPPAWLLRLAVATLCAGAAAIAGGLLGMHGLQKMHLADAALIFAALAAFIWLGAESCVSEMIPGSRHILTPPRLMAAACVAMTAVFACLFRDYRIERFVAQGIPCLKAGLALAAPVALACWLILRRGMAVDRPAAGLAFGILAGLSGLAMLELHCANFEAVHVMVWHTAVPLLSGAVGLLATWRRR